MSMMDTGCNIFVNWRRDRADLEHLLRAHITAFSGVWCETWDVLRNPRRTIVDDAPDLEFTEYPYYVELYTEEIECSLEDAIAVVTSVVRLLHANGVGAVPACEYEDLLPPDVRY